MKNHQRENLSRRELRRRAIGIARLAQKLEQISKFATNTPPKLCSLIGNVAKLLTDSIEEAPAGNLIHVGELLSLMSLELRFVERAKLEHTPWSMIQSTEEFLKHTAGDDSHFIIRPQWSQNYGLIGEFVKVYERRLCAFDWINSEKIKEALKDVDGQKIYCISFPRTERFNALMHANFGHELGHIIASKWDEAHFEEVWNEIENQAREENKKEIEQWWSSVLEGNDFLLAREISAATKRARSVLDGGLKELISDAIGVHLLGPAALCSAVEFSSCMSLDDNPSESGDYPPWRYRLRLLLESCKKDFQAVNDSERNGIPQKAEEIILEFVKWAQSLGELTEVHDDSESLNRTAITRIPYNHIEQRWPGILKEAKGFLPKDSSYSFSERIDYIAELVLRLDEDIPPCETGKWPDTTPADFRDILNAAWVYKIWLVTKVDDGTLDNELEKLFRLVLKAIETSHVQRTFNSLSEVAYN